MAYRNVCHSNPNVYVSHSNTDATVYGWHSNASIKVSTYGSKLPDAISSSDLLGQLLYQLM